MYDSTYTIYNWNQLGTDKYTQPIYVCKYYSGFGQPIQHVEGVLMWEIKY